MWRHRGRALLVTALLAGPAGLVGACDAEPAHPAAPRSASPAGAPARFQRPPGTCPSFSSKQAGQFAASGRGTVGGPSPAASVAGVSTVDCQWASAAARPSVSTSISVFPDGFAPAGNGTGNARNFFDGLRTDADQDALDSTAHIRVADQKSSAGPAFVAAYAGTGTVTQSTLVDNAVVTVVVRDRDTVTDDLDARADDLLRRVGPAAEVLTGAAVRSLR